MSVHSKMTAIADAIRGKTGGTNPLTLDQMATAIAEIQTGGGGGDNTLLESIVMGTATSVSLGEQVTTIKDHLFENVTTLKEFDFSHIQAIRTEAFKGCTGLTDIYLPAIVKNTNHGSRAFQGCTSLKRVSLPIMTGWYSAAGGWFSGCSSLTDVDVPELTAVAAQLFTGCTALKKLDLPKVNSLGASCFQGCTALTALILRNNAVVTLANINAFTNTPFASGGTGGTVYVPAALIESYQTATNWSTLYAAETCNFAAIEGSEYE